MGRGAVSLPGQWPLITSIPRLITGRHSTTTTTRRAGAPKDAYLLLVFFAGLFAMKLLGGELRSEIL